MTFTPTPLVALLIIARTLGNSRGINFALASALVPNRLALLFLLWVVAVTTTLLMPRMFAGSVEVIPVRGFTTGSSPLYPSTQNVSQLVYLSISIFAVFAFARLLQKPAMRQEALKAMCFGGAVVVVTGMLDLATQYAPIGPLLEPFRTASYALLTDVEVLGAKRVVGLTPEASSYGGLCVGFLASLYFFRAAIAHRRLRERIVPALMLLLAGFAALSTSSSAYVGLAVFAMLAVLEWLWRAAALQRGSRRRHGLAVEFWLVFAALIGSLLVIMVHPALLDPAVAMVDTMVFQKTSSQSFEERSMWTAVSLQAFFDTFGLGVGMGGTRASNAVVAVFSNLGFFGGLLYYGFVAKSLLRRFLLGDGEGATMLAGVRWSFAPSPVSGALAGTSADFGSFNAFQFGLAAAVAFSVPMIRRQGPASGNFATPPAHARQ